MNSESRSSSRRSTPARNALSDGQSRPRWLRKLTINRATVSASRCSASQTLGGTRAGRLPKLAREALRLGPEALDVAQLDVLVAADHVRQTRDLRDGAVGRRVEVDERVVDQALVLADQLALDTPHLGEAERVERLAAQPLHRPQHPEAGAHQPRWDAQLALEAHRAQERRV